MNSRLDCRKVFPEGMKFVHELVRSSQNHGLEPGLLDLVKLRASQINGCVFCIDLYVKDTRGVK